MARKNKALALLAVFLLVALAAVACSGSLAKSETAEPQAATADDGGEEEVLDAGDDPGSDDFQEADEETTEQKSGKLLMSVTYLAMSLGAAALPFLSLL